MSAATVEARPLTILLVEDNPDDAILLERHLRRNGFNPSIERVETPGEMQVQLRRAELPELVLADYNLPNFSGPAALRLLKRSGFDIPFIMLSGAISEDTAVESMRAGAQDYVTKQNLARLVPAVERELKEAVARRNRLAAEMALRAAEDRFHRLVEAMPLGLLIGEASNGRITYGNGAAERLLGFSSANAASLTLGDVCSALRDPDAVLADAASPPVPFEAICVTTEGRSIEVLIGVALLNPDALLNDRQIVAFIADLTIQKRSEELLRRTEKLAVAGRLAASIAHEINNPLEAITNLLYLLQHTTLGEDARSYLQLAQAELDRVAQITTQTLRFYRQSTKAGWTDVQELVRTVLTLFDSRLRHLQAEVNTRFRAVPKIYLREGEVRQVIANFVSNSMDALPHGGRILLRTTSATHRRTGVPGVVITVADTGAGMDAETLTRIFEPFFSTKGATGTGLGLWISLEIIEKHHGTLRVRSRRAGVGRTSGTVFRLFLPSQTPVLPGDGSSADRP